MSYNLRESRDIRQALLKTIYGTESPGYNVMYGGGTFDSYADHPRQAVPITTGPNAGQYSTAAGKPQFLAGTWDELQRELNLPDFSPHSQDRGAWHLAAKTYNRNTGRDLESVLETGNPNDIAQVGQELSGKWTSLPGGIEQATDENRFVTAFNTARGNTETQMPVQTASNDQEFRIISPPQGGDEEFRIVEGPAPDLADVPQQAYKNFLPSAKAFGQAMVYPFNDPLGTVQSLGNLGYGATQLASRGGNQWLADRGLARRRDPEAEDQGAPVKMARAYVDMQKGRLGSYDAIKRTMANDPVGFLGDLSMLAGGGGGLLARVPGTVGRIGKVTSKVGGAIDPTNAVTKPIGLLGKAITPNPVSPERMALLTTLKDEGVHVTAGQKTGNKRLQYREAELGGSKIADILDTQGEQFTSAALKKAGISAERATPEVMNKAFKDVGKQFDDLSVRHDLTADPKLAQDIQSAVVDYAHLTGKAARAPIIEKMALDIIDAAKRGMTGQQYQSYRSRLSSMARKTNDPQAKEALNALAHSLDDAMERTLIAKGSPDIGAWRETRSQYRNLLVIEDAAARGGEKIAEGIISPSALRGATVTKQGKRNYVRGTGDYADLARAGEAILKPLPNSGTAPRLQAGGRGLLAGATVWGAGRALLSKPVQSYLGNQVLPRNHPLRKAGSAAKSLALPAYQAGRIGLLGQI